MPGPVAAPSLGTRRPRRVPVGAALRAVRPNHLNPGRLRAASLPPLSSLNPQLPAFGPAPAEQRKFGSRLQTLGLRIKNRFQRDETGATAVEYGIMVGLIAVAIIATLALLGPELNSMFDDVLKKLQGTTTTTP